MDATEITSRQENAATAVISNGDQSHSPPVNSAAMRSNESPKDHRAAWGIVFGAGSALGYALANAFLREASREPAIWVAAIKAACTAAIFCPWLILLAVIGKRVLPPLRICGMLLAVSFFVQYFGNVFYQYAIQKIGLVLAVPVNLGVMILSGAVLGRILMREPLTPKITAGLAVIIVSIAILSAAGHQATNPSGDSLSALQQTWLAGTMAAAVSGFSYAVLGIAIRKSMQHGIPLATPIVFVSVVGTVGLMNLSVAWEGPLAIAVIDQMGWFAMIAAGVFNGMAFLCLTKAFKLLPVVYVNGINAANLMFSALFGVLFFWEPWNVQLTCGMLLMFVGMAVLAYGANENRLRLRRLLTERV